MPRRETDACQMATGRARREAGLHMTPKDPHQRGLGVLSSTIHEGKKSLGSFCRKFYVCKPTERVFVTKG